MRFVRLNEAKPNKQTAIVYINPDHVVAIRELVGGTQIMLIDGNNIIVKENLTTTVDALQGTKS
ncbi:MAG TPA: hypothetical protein VN950_19060 [Terriglobales bacterium]|nr:hypothetical protein [Terriglobales bacterium]